MARQHGAVRRLDEPALKVGAEPLRLRVGWLGLRRPRSRSPLRARRPLHRLLLLAGVQRPQPDRLRRVERADERERLQNAELLRLVLLMEHQIRVRNFVAAHAERLRHLVDRQRARSDGAR